MALNVALPSPGIIAELQYARCALLSPLSDDFDENLELLVSPYESSESGIGSSNDTKKSKSTSDDDDSSSSSDSSISSISSISPMPPGSEPTSPKSNIKYRGRDILDLARNLTDNSWKFHYARLPDNNVTMFMANRSQYHRLGANGLNREYDLASCPKCTFQFPVNSPNITFNDDGANNANAKPMQSNEKAQNNLPSFKMYKHF